MKGYTKLVMLMEFK